MFANPQETLSDIISGLVLMAIGGIGGWLAKHLQIGWKSPKKIKKASSDLKRELCRQIRELSKRVEVLARKNDRLQRWIDKLLKENAELKVERQLLVNSVAALRAKVEKFSCTK